MSITINSPFKAPARISKPMWLATIAKAYTTPLFAGIPPEDRPAVAAAMYDEIVAAKHDPAIFLGIGHCEHSLGTNPDSVLHRNDTRSLTNARTVRDPSLTGWKIITDAVRKSQYVKYQSVVDSLLDGIYRVDEPGYAYRQAKAVSIIDHTVIWTEGDGPQYAARMVAFINDLIARDAGTPPKPEPSPPAKQPHIAIAAGHWNTAGGNHDERETVKPLAFEIARQLREHGGFHVTMMTPEQGNYPGDHNAVARAVMALHATQPVDLYWECHTEGTDNTANRGAFGVVPWWPKDNPGDKDTDAITISADLVRRMRDATGIPIKTTNVVQPGVMAEYQTGVGGQGFRLGVFAYTTEAKATMTRCIFEYGAHTNPQDFAIQRQPWFTGRAARATVEAIAAFFGVAVSDKEPQGTPAPDPNVLHFPETGFSISGGFKAYWEQFGGLAVFGFPITSEYEENGVRVQWFERARFEWHPGSWPERYDVLCGLLGVELLAARERIDELEETG